MALSNQNYGQSHVGGHSGLSATDKANFALNRSKDIGNRRSPKEGGGYHPSLSSAFPKAAANPIYYYPLGTVWHDAKGEAVGIFRLNIGNLLRRDGYDDTMFSAPEGR